MLVRVVQPVYWRGQRRRIGDVLEIDEEDFINEYGVVDPPHWAVEYRQAPACSGAPSVHQPFGRRTRYGPPRPKENSNGDQT